MGADLYILPSGVEDLQSGEPFEQLGHFRDSYNEYGLFSVMSGSLGRVVSWWKMLHEGGFDPAGVLSAEEVARFKELIQPNIVKFIGLPEDAYFSAGGQPILPSEVPKYRKWAKDLLDVLDKAVELGKPMLFSV